MTCDAAARTVRRSYSTDRELPASRFNTTDNRRRPRLRPRWSLPRELWAPPNCYCCQVSDRAIIYRTSRLHIARSISLTTFSLVHLYSRVDIVSETK